MISIKMRVKRKENKTKNDYPVFLDIVNTILNAMCALLP